jgi:hypothetical protein
MNPQPNPSYNDSQSTKSSTVQRVAMPAVDYPASSVESEVFRADMESA